MTPNTILHLTEDQLCVDRLAGPDLGQAGWVRLADIQIEDGDFVAGLEQAKSHIGDRANLTVILPMDQVKVLDLDTSGLTRQQVLEALNGQTPFPTSDLCFDWFSDDVGTHVAAVAKQTVSEALTFLKSCGITPDSFAALPKATWGQKFAFFGNGENTDQDTSAPPNVPYVLLPAPQTTAAPKPVDPPKDAPPVHLVHPDESTTAPQVAVVGDTTKGSAQTISANKGVVAPPKRIEDPPARRVSKSPPAQTTPTLPPGTVRGKPKYLGLILTALLLLVLLAAGAWAGTIGRPILAAWFGLAPEAVAIEDIPFDPDQPLVPLETVDAAPALSPNDMAGGMIDQAPDLSALRNDLDQMNQARPRPAVATPSSLGGVVLDNSDTLAGLQVETASLAQPRPQLSAPSGLAQPGLSAPNLPTQVSAPQLEEVFRNDPVAASPQSTPSLPSISARATRLTVPSAPPLTDTVPLGIGNLDDPDISVGLPLINSIAVLSPEQRYVVTGVWIFPPERPGRTVLEGPLRRFVRYAFAQPTAPRDTIRLFQQAALPIDPLPRVGAGGGDAEQPRYQPELVAPSFDAEDTADTPDGIAQTDTAPIEPELDTAQIAPPVRPTIRPQMRPTADLEAAERERLGGYTLSELRSYRPSLRPEEILREGRAAAKRAEELANRPDSLLAIDRSVRPTVRPKAIVTAARNTPKPRVAPVRQNEVARPTAQTRASVARAATETRQLRLGRASLLGISGPSSNRRALVRMSNGKIIRVRVGDRLDGGRVAAIGSNQLRYVKSGKNISLRLP